MPSDSSVSPFVLRCHDATVTLTISNQPLSKNYLGVECILSEIKLFLTTILSLWGLIDSRMFGFALSPRSPIPRCL